MHYRSPTTAGLAPGTLKGKSLLAVWKADRRSPAFQGAVDAGVQAGVGGLFRSVTSQSRPYPRQIRHRQQAHFEVVPPLILQPA